MVRALLTFSVAFRKHLRKSKRKKEGGGGGGLGIVGWRKPMCSEVTQWMYRLEMTSYLRDLLTFPQCPALFDRDEPFRLNSAAGEVSWRICTRLKPKVSHFTFFKAVTADSITYFCQGCARGLKAEKEKAVFFQHLRELAVNSVIN